MISLILIFFHQYIHENLVRSPAIVKYIKNQKRTSFCKCTDGCQNPKKCSCYKYNSSLFKPTYETQIHDNGTMIALQPRAIQATNKNFTFNECHPRCHCHKDLCMNYLTNSQNKHRWKVVVRRITKQTTFFGKQKNITMWGLFALEQIQAGAFVVDYVGEVLTAKDGDKRGKVYDSIGMSYLFDMNEPDETDEYDMMV